MLPHKEPHTTWYLYSSNIAYHVEATLGHAWGNGVCAHSPKPSLVPADPPTDPI